MHLERRSEYDWVYVCRKISKVVEEKSDRKTLGECVKDMKLLGP